MPKLAARALVVTTIATAASAIERPVGRGHRALLVEHRAELCEVADLARASFIAVDRS